MRCVDRRSLLAWRSGYSLPAAGSLDGLLLHAGIACMRSDVIVTSPRRQVNSRVFRLRAGLTRGLSSSTSGSFAVVQNYRTEMD